MEKRKADKLFARIIGSGDGFNPNVIVTSDGEVLAERKNFPYLSDFIEEALKHAGRRQVFPVEVEVREKTGLV